MGYIYTETYTDNKDKKILVLNPRDALIRRLNITNRDWFGTSSLMVGALIGACGLTNETSSHVDETLPSTPHNYFSLGIKSTTDLSQPSNELIPFQSGCSYLGITTKISTATTVLSSVNGLQSSIGYGFQGPTGSHSYTTADQGTANFSLPVTGARFLGVKISHYKYDAYSAYNVTTNPYVPQMSLQYSAVRDDIRSDNIESIISQYLNGYGTTQPGGNANANPGVNALNISNNVYNINDVSFFLRWPFFNSKLKVYGYGWAIL